LDCHGPLASGHADCQRKLKTNLQKPAKNTKGCGRILPKSVILSVTLYNKIYNAVKYIIS